MRSMSMTTTITQPATRILYLAPTEEKSSKKPKRKVVWTEDTVDNENLNRLKSNICCIYHKPHDINEHDCSSETCTSDDDANGIERSRETKKKHKKVCSKHTSKDNKEKEEFKQEK